MYQQIVFAAATAILVPAAFAALEHPAQQQVQQNIDTVLKIIKNQSLSEQQKIRQVEQYANRFLDYERLSAMAVGQPWRQFSPQQKQSFIAAFKEMVIGMYARSAMMARKKPMSEYCRKSPPTATKSMFIPKSSPRRQKIRSCLPALPNRFAI